MARGAWVMMSIVLLVISASCQRDAAEIGAARTEVAPPTAQHPFGGGYRDAKWGMDAEAVKALLSKEGFLPGSGERQYTEGPAFIEVRHETPPPAKYENPRGPDITRYNFYKGRLFLVIYYPHLSALSDVAKVEALMSLLKSKFGDPVHTTDAADARLNDRWAAGFFAWNDGETAITLIARVEPERTLVRYGSVAIGQEQANELAQQREEKRQRDLQQMQSPFAGRL